MIEPLSICLELRPRGQFSNPEQTRTGCDSQKLRANARSRRSDFAPRPVSRSLLDGWKMKPLERWAEIDRVLLLQASQVCGEAR